MIAGAPPSRKEVPPTQPLYKWPRKDAADWLERKARDMRADILKMLNLAGSGHTGGSLSVIDILTVLYYYKMRFYRDLPRLKDKRRFVPIPELDPDTENGMDQVEFHLPHPFPWPEWNNRDRMVLSKGHSVPALYAILADLGFFPKNYLWTLRQLGSPLQGHPDRLTTPGIEVSTGSLGQGLSILNGMAMAGNLDGLDLDYYVVLGDGECQEGQVWEAAMTTGFRWKDNEIRGRITAIIDYNNIQIDGTIKEIKDLEPLDDKFRAFNWGVIELSDGNDTGAIIDALTEREKMKGPVAILARTVKGKGVSFMENTKAYHGIAPRDYVGPREGNPDSAEALKIENWEIFKALIEIGVSEEEVRAWIRNEKPKWKTFGTDLEKSSAALGKRTLT